MSLAWTQLPAICLRKRRNMNRTAEHYQSMQENSTASWGRNGRQTRHPLRRFQVELAGAPGSSRIRAYGYRTYGSNVRTRTRTDNLEGTLSPRRGRASGSSARPLCGRLLKREGGHDTTRCVGRVAEPAPARLRGGKSFERDRRL
ncbi:hypothetical protein C8R47DRAFT_1077065 [Mycena vitilis]|nr:hypothetical protein C8R47DRAFT_1077065 [Mycena vitilis]